MIDAIYCEHANESGNSCRCGGDCYCKAHTCRVEEKRREMAPIGHGGGPEDFGGSDYDTDFESGWEKTMRERREMDAFTAAWERDTRQYKAAHIDNQPVPSTNMLVDSAQPNPIINDNPPIHIMVVKDFEDRAEFGKSKYGTYLQADNGRDTLKDAYQEALDLCQYLRSMIYKRDGR